MLTVAICIQLMPRRTEGPLHQLVARLDLGPELGPAFERIARHNARSLSAEAMIAIRHWVAQHEKPAVTAVEQGR